MSLNKKKMVREIGRRTRIRNRDVQAVIEALIDVWTEELVSGGRIEIENFLVIELQPVDRGSHKPTPEYPETSKVTQHVRLRASNALKQRLETLRQ